MSAGQAMSFDWRSLLSLKGWVIALFILLWNVGIVGAMLMGGGISAGAFSELGMRLTGLVCVLACVFFLTVARSATAQSLCLANERRDDFRPRDFYFLALLTGLLAASRFFFPVSEVFA